MDCPFVAEATQNISNGAMLCLCTVRKIIFNFFPTAFGCFQAIGYFHDTQYNVPSVLFPAKLLNNFELLKVTNIIK